MFIAHLVIDPVTTLIAFGLGALIGFAARHFLAQREQNNDDRTS